MKKISNMSKEKAQRILFITVLILVFGVFFITLSLIEPNEDPIDDPIEDPDDDPDDDPVVTYETILVPFAGELDTVRKFYSLDQPEEDQLVSIINFGSQYFTSKGVSYANDNLEFEVLASLSGTVKEVTDSPVYGKVVVLEHDEGIETEYSSLNEVSVVVGDEVKQGDVLGTSGTNEYDKGALNHVHFQVSVDGKYYDPVKLIGKKINELGLE